MKAKTISGVIRRKVEKWLSTITDEEVRDLAAKNTIVTGGCITSMLLNEKVNDFDIYFRNKKTALAVAKYYCKQFIALNGGVKNKKLTDPFVEECEDGRIKIVIKSAGVTSETTDSAEYDYFEGRSDEDVADYCDEVFGDAEQTDEELPAYRPVFMSANAITLSDKVQLVLRFYGKPEDIHENYDFVHCTNYWESKSGKLTLRKDALEAILTRELRYVGSKYPLTSIIRTRKFIQRGWSINVGQYVKMCMHLNDMDLTDPNVLEEQLTGVDVAYFTQLIRKVQDSDPQAVNSTYICTILDKMF